MILVCSPSNPTGAVYDEATLRALAKLAVEKDVWLMTDDIYRTLVYGDGKFFQPATIEPGGARPHHHHRRRVEGVRDDRLARRVHGRARSRWSRRWRRCRGSRRRTRRRSPRRRRWPRSRARPTSSRRCASSSTSGARPWSSGCARSRASPASSPRARSTRSPTCRRSSGKKTPEGKKIENDVQLCEWLIEAARVAVVMGSAFHAPGFVRLSYATSMKNVEEGVRRMAEALPKLT